MRSVPATSGGIPSASDSLASGASVRGAALVPGVGGNEAARSRMRDWLGERPLWPGVLLSVIVHGFLFWQLARWMETWERPPVGFTDEAGHEIGVVLRSRGRSVDVSAEPSPRATESVDQPPPDPLEAVPTIATPATIPTAVPKSANTVAAPALPVIGAGVPSPGSTDPRERQTPGTMTPGTVAQQLDAALPGTAFFGAKDKGSRVVFVVDSSASMAQNGAMRSAKAALVAAVQTFAEAQQFQIVFYNQQPTPLTLRGKTGELYFATEVNKTLARQVISAVEPDSGTDHMPALRLALRMSPEVVFFLTDADEPRLSAKELDEIKRLNQGRARIHTIEFGRGAPLAGVDNFLTRLARQNGGTYRYHDVRSPAIDPTKTRP